MKILINLMETLQTYDVACDLNGGEEYSKAFRKFDVHSALGTVINFFEEEFRESDGFAIAETGQLIHLGQYDYTAEGELLPEEILERMLIETIGNSVINEANGADLDSWAWQLDEHLLVIGHA